MMIHSDPKRENVEHALPDVEVFHIDSAIDHDVTSEDSAFVDSDGDYLGDGWYWWACMPGCLPDSDPNGPFDTEDEAIASARDF